MTFLKIFSQEFFLAGTFFFLLLLGLEIFWPGLVQAYLNLSAYLFFWLVFAIINVLWQENSHKDEKK